MLDGHGHHPQYPPPPPFYPPFVQGSSSSHPYRPPFAGPPTPMSTPSASSQLHASPRIPPASNFIDLTSSPSPSPKPTPRPVPPVAGSPSPNTQVPLPDSMPPKTPVCIGQLNVNALILYPTNYLQSTPEHPHPEQDWALVRLNYERNETRPGNEDTIHILTPARKGDSQPGENFGIVEQKVSSILGPMLSKGLIRLDTRVKRGMPNLPILPLEALVYTPKGNIPVVGNYLRRHQLLLDHPRPGKCNFPYFNPHNPPPGGFGQSLILDNRAGYLGPGGSSRWAAQSGKSVEVQRSQVDELFKSLRSGDELPESQPPPEISTPLYPHQKKALTFLLEREREILGPEGKPSSLWQERSAAMSGRISWYHLVTQQEVHDAPTDCRGAILADDMGLGKTITCVSLIASTLGSAKQFEQTPLEAPPPPPPTDALSPSHFTGSVWGMPNTPSPSLPAVSLKAKARETKEHDSAQAQYTRACRIKVKSRATLIICPLSTVSNWEDQFREHWNGSVTVLGGSGTCEGPGLTSNDQQMVSKTNSSLRVYVYHGNARRPDPVFLGNCDVVITTFSTLASEYSKQSRSKAVVDDDGDSSDSAIEFVGSNVPSKKKPAKRKRAANGAESTSPLQSVFWFRVVLDEAHSIKEISTVACRASCDLMADRRLCLTGTPVQNKLDDVFALIKFLRLRPLDEKAVWTEFIGTPVKYGQPLGVARLQSIMKCITLRRTKESRTPDGERILSLPPRRDELRYLKFDANEQLLYDRFFNESKAEFRELSHKNEVMKNYVGILQKILRLRQICDHFELVKGKGLFGEDGSYEDTVAAIATHGITVARAAVVFALLKEAATTQCAECGYELAPYGAEAAERTPEGEPSTPSAGAKRGRKGKAASSRAPTRASSPTGTVQAVMTRCQHLFCLCCYKRIVDPAWPKCAPELSRPCSVCQSHLLPSDAVIVDPDYGTVDTSAKHKFGKRERERRGKGISSDEFHASTKIKALLGDLEQFSRANPHSKNYDPGSLDVQMVDDQGNIIDEGATKTVVFSQWTTMLDKVEDALDFANIRYDRLDGTMKREDRSRAMDALKNDPGCEVLLVSLKAGGVGLNLTAAQRVYLMDPYWNPAVENQAVDRIHRLGQTRPVTTIKLIIENSIEDRLLEVQRKKTELANMTLSGAVSKAELSQRRMEELQRLFGP
ncbi:SNF2 family N-terminal domain-containing protein [Amylostereum chailletii]|nr:SNF2 family N-terminal domain-containing protein [Amylostereum chailletii]